MAWNEPGDKDPWGNRNKNQGGPPDLDEVVRKMQQKLGGLFGKRKGNGQGGGGDGVTGTIVAGILAIALGLWAITGIYVVDAAEQAVVLRLGKFHHFNGPGLHWRIPYPVDDIFKVNVEKINNVSVGVGVGGSRENESLMLTKDENIVDIQIAVQYKVNDAKKFLFNVRSPDRTLKDVTESALREVVGKSKMDFVLTDGRAEIQEKVRNLTQELIDLYEAGLQVTSLNIQNAQAPRQVQHAFADVVKAREDKQRFINKAETYRNERIPKARGEAARIIELSEGYRDSVIAQAEGETKRFLAVLSAYEKAPQVTRERMYLETIETVLRESNKVVVDLKSGNNMMFLPLDKIFRGREAAVNIGDTSPADNTATRNAPMEKSFTTGSIGDLRGTR